MRTRRDLVDHRPWERHGRLVLHVGEVLRRREAVRHPRLRHLDDGRLELLAVVRAVVHRDDGDRKLAGAEALQQQRRDHGHRVPACLGALLHVRLHHRKIGAVRLAQLIALLCDREGQHLQRRRAEYRLEVIFRLRVREVRLDALRDAREHFLGHRAVGIEQHVERQVVLRGVDLVDDIVVERVAGDDARLRKSFVQQPLRKRTNETAKDVARAEMHPFWLGLGTRAHCGNVERRQLHAGLFPRLFVVGD